MLEDVTEKRWEGEQTIGGFFFFQAEEGKRGGQGFRGVGGLFKRHWSGARVVASTTKSLVIIIFAWEFVKG